MGVVKRLKDKIRGYFLAGLVVLLPLGITLLLISAVFRLLDRLLVIIPPRFHPHNYLPFKIPGLGLLLALFLVMVTGVVVKNYVGGKVIKFGEYVLGAIPLVRPVYLAVKQLSQAVLGGSQDAFRRVILVEFPRRGVYALAFVTSRVSGELREKTGDGMINVFVPTTPNPTSGFYLMVPEGETLPLSISVEDAFKLLISGGVVEPGGQPPSLPFGRRSNKNLG